MSDQKDIKRLLSSLPLVSQMRQMNVYMPNAAISGLFRVVQRVQADCKSQSLPIPSSWTDVGSLLDTVGAMRTVLSFLPVRAAKAHSFPLEAESMDIPDFLKERAAVRECERDCETVIF